MQTDPTTADQQFQLIGANLAGNLEDMTSAWVPYIEGGQLSAMVVGFNDRDPETGALSAGYGRVMPAQSETVANAELFRWDDNNPTTSVNDVWPVPDNACDALGLPCSGNTPPMGDSWVMEYTHSLQVLFPGRDGTVALLALVELRLASSPFAPVKDLVLLTSRDTHTGAGKTFDKAHIISAGAAGSFGVQPESVSATVKVANNQAAAAFGSTMQPIFMVWRNGLFDTPDEGWYGARAAIGTNGDVVVTTGPFILPPLPEASYGSTAIAAYNDSEGEEWVQLVASRRRVGEEDIRHFDACPSEQRVEVEWTIYATNDFSGSGSWQDDVLATDRQFKPCVGASYATMAEPTDIFPNSDRPVVLAHRNSPRASLYAISRSEDSAEPNNNWETGPNHFVYVYKADLVEHFWTDGATDDTVKAPKETAFTSPAEGQDKYAPELVIHHGEVITPGVLANPPIIALRYKDVANYWLTHPTYTQLAPELEYWGWDDWDTGGVGSASGEQYKTVGVRHGLSVLQACVDHKFDQDCSNKSINWGVFYPDVPFRASWLDAPDVVLPTDAWTRMFTH